MALLLLPLFTTMLPFASGTDIWRAAVSSYYFHRAPREMVVIAYIFRYILETDRKKMELGFSDWISSLQFYFKSLKLPNWIIIVTQNHLKHPNGLKKLGFINSLTSYFSPCLVHHLILDSNWAGFHVYQFPNLALLKLKSLKIFIVGS